MRGPRLLRPEAVAVAWFLPLGVLFWAGLLAAARWPRYWLWIAPEQTPMTFLEVLLLFAAAALAALTALLGRLPGGDRLDQRFWLLLGTAFLVLMADERFALHERLRDNLLSHMPWRLPWGSPGDYVLLVYGLAGAGLLPALLRRLRNTPPAGSLFLGGVVLAALAVLADSYDVARLGLAGERLEQTLEEVVEGVADALLVAGLFVHFCASLEAIRRASPEGPASPGPGGQGPAAENGGPPRGAG